MRIRFSGLFTQCARRRRAVAAAELAFILPVLVTLVLGAVDFGRFAYYYIAVTNAARAGAQYGIMHNAGLTPTNSIPYPTWQAGVQQAVINEMSQQVGSGNVPAQPTPTTIADPYDASHPGIGRVQVTAAYNFTTVVNWQWTGLGIPHTLSLQRKVEMRMIR